MAGTKTLNQINREFIEEHKLIEPVLPPDENYGDMERRIQDLRAHITSVTSGSSRLKKADEVFAPPEPVPSAGVSKRLRQKEKKESKNNRIAKRFTDIALYAAVIIVLIAALFFNGSSSKGFHIFGYTGFTVLGTSMQSEIPEGSLVLAGKAVSDNLIAGDDIIFVSKNKSIVTHRIIEIIENYENSNDRGFRTQGIDNKDPDQEVVYAENVIGVVKHTIPGLGTILTFISENIGMFLTVAILILAGVRLLAEHRQKKREPKKNAIY
ncbi:MAG: signal peptidase I [Oscillospiraceae bacterium]|nr:signal peptidase I [Oscillospiraceae bacterium]